MQTRQCCQLNETRSWLRATSCSQCWPGTSINGHGVGGLTREGLASRGGGTWPWWLCSQGGQPPLNVETDLFRFISAGFWEKQRALSYCGLKMQLLFVWYGLELKTRNLVVMILLHPISSQTVWAKFLFEAFLSDCATNCVFRFDLATDEDSRPSTLHQGLLWTRQFGASCDSVRRIGSAWQSWWFHSTSTFHVLPSLETATLFVSVSVQSLELRQS